MFGLRPRDAPEVLTFLSKEPVESVFLRGLILRSGILPGDRYGRLLGHRGPDGRLTGVLLASPLSVPFAVTSEAAQAFGRELMRSRVRVRNIVGRRETVRELWQAMGPGRPVPRLIRERQPVYWVTASELVRSDRVPIRRATARDLDAVVAASAAMMLEEVEEDPLADRPTDYRRFVRDRILRGDEYIWTDVRGLCFKCNISSRTPDVAQIEGVYTPPERRGQALATRALSTLCAKLLESVPKLCLYVNDFNLPAIRLYEKLGFKRAFDYQSIFFAARDG